MQQQKSRLKHCRSKRTVACDISPRVRQTVALRDRNRCIFCQSHEGLQIAHYITRSAGGLGIEENLTLACIQCHRELDQGTHRDDYRRFQKNYLDKHYPGFSDEERRYKKWKN